MRAIIISHPGDAEVLQLTERPKPSPGINEVLIRVKAAGGKSFGHSTTAREIPGSRRRPS